MNFHANNGATIVGIKEKISSVCIAKLHITANIKKKIVFRNDVLMANSCRQQQYNNTMSSTQHFLSDFKTLYTAILTNFGKNYSIPNFTEILPVISALIHADGRTDMKLTGAFGDYVSAPEKNILSVQNVMKCSEK